MNKSALCSSKWARDGGDARSLTALRMWNPREFVERMLIEGMGARELSCGYDFTFGKKGAGDTRLLSQVAAEHGVGLNIIQPVLLDGKPVSSTRIRQAILDGRMDDAKPGCSADASASV